MSYVIKAVLCSAQQPEYGEATVCFPIPDAQYDRTARLLEAAKMGAALVQDCQVNEIDSFYRVLDSLKGTTATMDELDYLAKRLDSFCDNEAEQFQAMAHKLGISDIKDFINLTHCCEQATVIADFSKLEEAGKAHRMNLNGGAISTAELEALDGREEALRLIESGAGTITPYGVVYDNGMVLKPVYNGQQFPEYLYDNSLLVLEVEPKAGPREGQNPEYLYLPASEHQIERALLRAGIDGFSDAQMRVDLQALPEKVAEALDLESLSVDDLPSLNRMCGAIRSMTKADLEKLNAVVLMADTSGFASICRLAENLDQFDFIPGVRTAEEYGRYMIRQSGYFEYDEHLEEFYDYRSYGEQRVQQEDGQFNECGYVAYRGEIPLEELMRETSLEQSPQGPQMGGCL
nr:antirestriction protein ArdA [uncultured Oscillibacter sp.]